MRRNVWHFAYTVKKLHLLHTPKLIEYEERWSVMHIPNLSLIRKHRLDTRTHTSCHLTPKAVIFKNYFCTPVKISINPIRSPKSTGSVRQKLVIHIPNLSSIERTVTRIHPRNGIHELRRRIHMWESSFFTIPIQDLKTHSHECWTNESFFLSIHINGQSREVTNIFCHKTILQESDIFYLHRRLKKNKDILESEIESGLFISTLSSIIDWNLQRASHSAYWVELKEVQTTKT